MPIATDMQFRRPESAYCELQHGGTRAAYVGLDAIIHFVMIVHEINAHVMLYRFVFVFLSQIQQKSNHYNSLPVKRP